MKTTLFCSVFIIWQQIAQCQNTGINISFTEDTLTITNNLLRFDVEFENINGERTFLYFADNICLYDEESTYRFSRGLGILITDENTVLFCSSLRKVTLIGYTEKRMNRIMKRNKMEKENGQLFCKRRRLRLTPGITTRHYQLNLCEQIPAGEYHVQICYFYVRDLEIDNDCIKCYPRTIENDKFYEGIIISDQLVLVKY